MQITAYDRRQMESHAWRGEWPRSAAGGPQWHLDTASWITGARVCMFLSWLITVVLCFFDYLRLCLHLVHYSVHDFLFTSLFAYYLEDLIASSLGCLLYVYWWYFGFLRELLNTSLQNLSRLYLIWEVILYIQHPTITPISPLYSSHPGPSNTINIFLE